MRILLLSAYDAVSHRYWRGGLVEQLPEHDWSVLALPDRHFSWRIRGNALSWAAEQRRVLEDNHDLVVATSMVDLATLKGLVPQLSQIPLLLYFHENQFAYPASLHARASVEAQITSIYSAMAAERLLFNSEYNRQTFLQGARDLLGKMPDHAPRAVVDMLESKSRLLPVPIADDCFSGERIQHDRLTLVWNHRWEYDKGPERLESVLRRLESAGLDFRIHIIGQQFRKQPEVFARMRNEFAHRILHWGYVERRSTYLDILRASDLALSTSLHDFQGLAMCEAMACGCIPVAPNRLAYPEYIDRCFLYDSHPQDIGAEAESMAARVMALAGDIESCEASLPERLSWSEMRHNYAMILREVGFSGDAPA